MIINGVSIDETFAEAFPMKATRAITFQNVTYESLDDIYYSKFSTGCNPHVLG